MLERKVYQWQQDLDEILQKQQPVNWEQDGHDFRATFRKVPAQRTWDLDHALVVVRSNIDGEQVETKLLMKRLAFSHFAEFTNRWDHNVSLYNDEIDGRFHSNGNIIVASNRKISPVFYGRVTAASGIRLDGQLRRRQVFLGGLDAHVKRIPLPHQVMPLVRDLYHEVPRDHIHIIDTNGEIVFHGDGEYTWTPAGGPTVHRRVLGDAFYIVGTGKREISVRGVVRGRVVVYSPELISISGDLRYARDPESFPDSHDYLGLISGRYVEIAPPNVTGPGDLTVYAAIYAQHRFSVTRFSRRNNGLLTIYGSLSAGSLSASEPRFATRIRFDPRFERNRPPGFPMTGDYELESWDKTWRVVN